jgi:hypothetical protein
LLNEGFSATPQCFPKQIKERLVSDALSGKLSAASYSDESRDLAKSIMGYDSLIKKDAIDKLSRCDVISIRAPICNAVSALNGSSPTIVLFDGLLDTAVTWIEMSYAVQGLPERLDQTFPIADFPTVSTKSWTAAIFCALINRYFTDGDPYPDFRVLLRSESIRGYVAHAFMGAAWWTLLHELGHIELGHNRYPSGTYRPALSDSLIVSESISAFQNQEFEADAFVYESLTDDGRKAFYAWTNYVLGAILNFELLYPRPHGTHPLSINRLSKAHELSKADDAMAVEFKTAEKLSSHGRMFENVKSLTASNRAKGLPPVFENFSATDLFKALAGFKGLYQEAGFDIDPFLDSRGGGWRNSRFGNP